MARRSSRRRSQQENQTDPGEDERDDELEVFEEPKRKAKRAPAKKKGADDQKLQENPDGLKAKVDTEEKLDYLEISIPDPTRPVVEEPVSLGTSSKASTKGKRSAAFDRQLRTSMRHVHILSLLTGYAIRSRRASESMVKALILSACPLHIQSLLSGDPRTLVNGLSMAANWWKNRFGLRLRRSPLDTSALSLDLKTLRRIVIDHQGYEEDLVLLFCALLRALGLQARLVTSLSPLPLDPLKTPQSELAEEFTFIPLHWVEVFHPDEARWIPVDCVRGIANCRPSMELSAPGSRISAKALPQHQHLFIVGIDNHGVLTDVTRRYVSKFYGQAWKLRQSDEAAFLRAIHRISARSACENSLLYDEEAELECFAAAEPMPKTLAGFQAHGKYVLENRIQKYQVFYPADAGIVGEFRGIPIRLRNVIHKVRSKEAWYTQYARILLPDAEPVKTIQLPKKKKKGLLTPGEDEYEPGAMQPLYGEWQTLPYIPPEAVDGRVPRNAHGNVDLFQPEMLPRGCVYIPYRGVWRSAKELGVDYADACVRFAFHGRMAVPNLQGIVVCREEEARVLAHYFRQVEADLAAANEATEKRELLRRRREALSASISERLREEYQEDERTDGGSAPIQSAFTRSAEMSEDEDFVM